MVSLLVLLTISVTVVLIDKKVAMTKNNSNCNGRSVMVADTILTVPRDKTNGNIMTARILMTTVIYR